MREASALIIRGAGERAFSAGADTGELDVATPETALAYYERTGDVYEQLARLPVPSIAQIHGWCVGGGLELALACDLRVAAESARFWFPEVERGILPSSGGTARAVRALGPAVARRLILLGEKISARDALALGVIHEVVPDGEEAATAMAWAQTLGGPAAARAPGRAPRDRRRRRRLARRRAGGRAPRLRGARRPRVSRSPDVVVVGGGIVGIAVAASCARRGLQVTLCEAAGLAGAASGRNQGLVIGPHHPVMESIGRRTLELFLDLHERSGRAFAFDREPHGCLILSPEGGDPMTTAELRAAEPLLAPHVEYAELNLDARRIDPGAAAATLADDARAAGAEIRTGCAVRELLRSGDRVAGVLTDDGRIEAQHVVVAAGPWSWRVCRTLPHDIPVRGVRGWILVTRPAPFRLRHAIEEEWTRPAPPAPTLAQLAEGTRAGAVRRLRPAAGLRRPRPDRLEPARRDLRRRRVARDAHDDREARGRAHACAGRASRSRSGARASGRSRPIYCR